MKTEQKQAIIESGKQYFRSIIIPNHLKNLDKLHLSSFDINPFFINYVTTLIEEDSHFIGLAKALVYPYIFDKVIGKSGGQDVRSLVFKLQEVTCGVSSFEGIDFEFVDAIDGCRKYCQFKAGVKTIVTDDIATILSHFKPLISQPNLDLQFEDLVVGVLYGEKVDLSAYYKSIDTHYPVLCGSDFWLHLTGDKNFYNRLLKAMGEVLDEGDFEGSDLIHDSIEEIAEEIRQYVMGYSDFPLNNVI